MSSTSGSYTSPHAILTDAQKVPCTFTLTVPSLGPALASTSSLESGTKLYLPLWLGEMLAVSKPGGSDTSSLASLDMPHALDPRVVNALRADPLSVDIRSQAQWFYALGERMLELFDEEELVDVLDETFKKRAIEIADKAQNTRTMQQGADGNEFMTGLDETERQLFRAAHDSTNAVKKWFEGANKS